MLLPLEFAVLGVKIGVIIGLVSRPAELPRQSLAKRCVNLSTHTASIK